MRIYLDNNATTAIHPDVLHVLGDSLRDVYGNASSIHKEGQRARQVIEDAREAVARLVGAAARDLVFTSGGTESNNAGIFGAVPHGGRHHIVTTQIEHPSVAEAVADLERRGNRVTRIAPSRGGTVAAADLIAAIGEETRLVTVMLANNETGVIQAVAEVGRACRERGIHFHCDAVQAVGKIDVDVDAIACDTLSISGHKIHAPKGIGALYVRRGLTMSSHMVGGAQERRRRAGTENVPLAAAFGAAAKIAGDSSWRAPIETLRDRFETALRSAFDVVINGAPAPRVPTTTSATFAGVDAEGLVIALDLSGVAVSTGSACSSGRVEPSAVLLAMGLTAEEAKSTVRFSMSRFTTGEEIDRVITLLRDLVPRCARQAMEPRR
ncbi:MAG TPA: cysteine desulfurase family protein [Thermoanaerobaculia bacterium]|nr:cysteine desulfurase family protein [Thermoanaerobaculia bacterium]